MPRIQDYKHLDSMKASCYLFNGKQRGVLSLNGHVQVFQMRHIQIFLSFFGTTTIELTHAVSLVTRSSYQVMFLANGLSVPQELFVGIKANVIFSLK